MKLEQKYLALIQEAQQRKMPDVDGIRLCFQTLSLAAGIDRDCATLLAPHSLSEGRFVLLFLLDAAPGGLAPNALAERAGVTRATVTGLLDGLERAPGGVPDHLAAALRRSRHRQGEKQQEDRLHHGCDAGRRVVIHRSSNPPADLEWRCQGISERFRA